jgi:aspartyl-tRNA(Asn)/glutamyl-tRNA(Gln) amidotransferase subunit B
MNRKAVEYAIKMGIACNSEINRYNYFARKNYFYPDLPKGYQVSQHTTPICIGGQVRIKTENVTRDIKLNRIHLEEDAGKSIHDIDEEYTCVDYNRAGVALIEIVTEPDINSAEEAYQYVTEVRRLVQWLNICDGNMEEGSLRCDANVSVRLKGETKLGTKVEVKNLNSIRNVKKAIEFEIERIITSLEKGEKIIQQTRSFDASNDSTFAIRDKEEANDYRYFPEPDLCPFHLTDEFIKEIEKKLPALPWQLEQKYVAQYNLSEYDASQLCLEKALADYFEAVIQHSKNYKAVANWINGPIKQFLNENKLSFADLTLTPVQLASLITMVEESKVNFSVAASQLLPVLMDDNKATPLQVATTMNLLQVSDSVAVEGWVESVINKMPEKVREYKKGKKGLIGLFVGEVKKISKGKADPKVVTELLQQKLEQ